MIARVVIDHLIIDDPKDAFCEEEPRLANKLSIRRIESRTEADTFCESESGLQRIPAIMLCMIGTSNSCISPIGDITQNYVNIAAIILHLHISRDKDPSLV